MGKSNIDPIIQNKLQNFKSQLDKEELWNSISGSISAPAVITSPAANTSSSNNLVIKATSLALLLALSAGIAYSILSPDQLMSGNIAESQSLQIVTPTPESESTTAFASTLDDDKETIVETTHLSDDIGRSEDFQQNKRVKTNLITSPVTTKKVEANIRKSVVSTDKYQYSTSTPVKRVTPNNTQSTQETLTTPTYKAATNAPLIQRSNDAIDQLSTLHTGSLLPFKTNEENLKISLANLVPIKDKVNCYDYSNKKPKISILAYYGPGMSFRALTANNNEMTTYETARKDSEVQLENHRAGLQVKASHKSGIYAKAGVEASIINEKFYQYAESIRTEIQWGLIETITLPDGTIEEKYGDREVTIISKKEWKNYNKFKTVDITAILGYEALINKWSYHLEGGIIYNLGSRFEGTYLDANTLQPHEVKSQDYYKSKTGIDLHFAAGIGYDLTNNVTLTLSPSVRYDLKMVNLSSYPLNQKYLMTSLLAGAEYRF